MRKIITGILAVILIMGLAISAAADETTASGACSDTAFWSLTDGVLTISGTGKVDPTLAVIIPWEEYSEQVRKVIVEEGITELGYLCFSGHSNLEEVILPDSLEVMGRQLFSSCNKLKEITIPKNVHTIGVNKEKVPTASVFPSSLENIWVDDENVHFYDIDGILYSRDDAALLCCPKEKKLRDFTVPDGIKRIEGSAFSDNILQSIVLPQGLEYIGYYAFARTELTQIQIPDTVTYISDNAFDYCNGLTEIVFPSSVAKVGNEVLSSCYKLQTVTFLNASCIIVDSPSTIPMHTLIVGYGDSTAEEYAKRYGRRFQNIDSGEISGGGYTEGMIPLLPTDIEASYAVSNEGSVRDYEGNRTGYQPHVPIITDPSHETYQDILRTTLEITVDCATDYEKALAVFMWVKENVEYGYGDTGGSFLVKNLYSMWEKRSGNCMVYTKLTNFMLSLLDIPTAEVSSLDHAWSAALIDGRWVMIDSTNGYFDNMDVFNSEIVDIFFCVGDLVCVIDDFTGVKLASYGTNISDTKTTNDIYIPDFVTYIYEDVFISRDYEKDQPKVTVRGEIGSYTESYVRENFDKYVVAYEGTKFIAKPLGNGRFLDVPDSKYYYDPILWAVDQQITNGTTKDTFSPDNACTRKQIVTFLWRAAGCPEPESMRNPFTDVTRGDQFEKAILWAYYKGITKGTSATEFSPEKSCTRKQIVTFLYRYFGEPGVNITENPFTDVAQDSFTKAILWAYHQGITTGKTATTFQPEEPCTRAQIVTFLYRSMVKDPCANGHRYVSNTVVPTCTENGYTRYTCSRCGESYTDAVVSASEHCYFNMTDKATCTEEGYILNVCSRCRDSHTISTLQPLGHEHELRTVAPTCTEEGYTVYTCTVCNESHNETYIPATGHLYNSRTVAPTCTEDGYREHNCRACGEVYRDEYVPALGHGETFTAYKNPTCFQDGFTATFCSVCNERVIYEQLPMFGGECSMCVTRSLPEVAMEMMVQNYSQYIKYISYKGWVIDTCEKCGYPDINSIRYGNTDTP